ncbi:carbohydrate ABC transporter permease [Clostridium tarantellae]|uniref:ABC transporter permease subunit n=1 Tax=Clostridium tarantellae TaxID=39493 RepID=A0A6I1MJX7_9CLOT|nr:sugar ABC transporter permease [Clostridium tarantellae]MPQ42728.1 ABC transporter permease subunit [Clostridium tarantellae]
MNSKKRKIFLAMCVIPAVVLFAIFMLYPIFKGFTMSLYEWSGLSGEPVFIGFDNFKTMLGDRYFIQAFKNTLFLLVIFPAITILISLFLAVAITQSKLREKNFYRVILFFPNILSMVVIGVLFSYVFDPSIGILKSFFEMIGLDKFAGIAWLGDSKYVLWALVITMVWQAVGYYMVIYIAGLDGISPELYEVCYLEGATSWQKFKEVTLPLLWEVVRVTFAFFITGAFNLSFIFVTVMTKGGPDGASEVLLTYMNKQAFTNSNYGYAMSIGVTVFIFALIMAIIVNKISDTEARENKRIKRIGGVASARSK